MDSEALLTYTGSAGQVNTNTRIAIAQQPFPAAIKQVLTVGVDMADHSFREVAFFPLPCLTQKASGRKGPLLATCNGQTADDNLEEVGVPQIFG